MIGHSNVKIAKNLKPKGVHKTLPISSASSSEFSVKLFDVSKYCYNFKMVIIHLRVVAPFALNVNILNGNL